MRTQRPFRVQMLLVSGVLLLGQQSGASGQHVSINTGNGPVERCDQLEVRFDEGPAVRAEESLRIAATGPLTVELRDRGGVGLREGTAGEHAVTICKAVPKGAERDLAAIRGVVKGTSLEVTGPADGAWMAYVLVASPRGSHVNLRATNGPIRVDAFEGRLDVRTINGPIALAQVRGEATARAENGPVKLEAGSGQISIETQNGPIGIRLTGDRWQGGQLEARAQNGPLSVAVPARYGSGIEIESTGHGPWSCRGVPGCETARTGFEPRTLHVGTGPTQVRLSTVNGPIKVQSANERTEDVRN
jgi:hypothetical protein